jgi:uncharacterized protein YbjT (DUF2867 family)
VITIVCAGGKTGHRAAEILLARGEVVRAFDVAPSRLAALKAKGAEVVVGNAEDAEALASAFRGARAVYAVFPEDLSATDLNAQGSRMGEAAVWALERAGVTRAVFLSSLGAELPMGTGPIVAAHDQEQRLANLSNINVTVLRAGYFMENLFAVVGFVKYRDVNVTPYAADLRLPMIATRDVAAIVAEELQCAKFGGFTIREILGPHDLTMAEATSLIGARVGKAELNYIQCSYDVARSLLVDMGVSANVADLYVEMYEAFNDQRIRSHQVADVIRTQTQFEEFVDDSLVPKFHNA